MLALYRSGRQAEALEVVPELCQLPAGATNWDWSPPPALRSRHTQVLQQSAELAWTPPTGTEEAEDTTGQAPHAGGGPAPCSAGCRRT